MHQIEIELVDGDVASAPAAPTDASVARSLRRMATSALRSCSR